MPRSSKNAVDGTRDGRVVVRVTAPPVDGAANEAAIAVVAAAIGVPKSAARVVAGATSRNKSIEIAGVSDDEIARRLER